MNNSIDQLVMLMSSDWFFPKWHLLGLTPSSAAMAALQMRCRALTLELLDGERDYWMIPFHQQRIMHTQEKFFSAAAESKFSESNLAILRDVSNRSEHEIPEHDTSLLVSLTLLLSKKGTVTAREPLEETVVNTVRLTAQTFELDIASMTPEWLCSDSDWDKQLRELTSDLPEFLADFAQDLVNTPNKFHNFWRVLTEKLDTEQKASLIAWYKGAAMNLVGHSIELPLLND